METKDILKNLRSERDLSVRDVAEKSGVSYSAYQKYELGIREIGAKSLQKLADFYGVTTDYLLGRPDAPEPPEPLKRPETLEEVVNMLDMDILMSGLYNILDDQKRRELSVAMTTLVERQRAREEAALAEKDADKDQEPTETTDKQASASAV